MVVWRVLQLRLGKIVRRVTVRMERQRLVVGMGVERLQRRVVLRRVLLQLQDWGNLLLQDWVDLGLLLQQDVGMWLLQDWVDLLHDWENLRLLLDVVLLEDVGLLQHDLGLLLLLLDLGLLLQHWMSLQRPLRLLQHWLRRLLQDLRRRNSIRDLTTLFRCDIFIYFSVI